MRTGKRVFPFQAFAFLVTHFFERELQTAGRELAAVELCMCWEDSYATARSKEQEHASVTVT